MVSVLVIFLGLVALLLLVAIVLYSIHRKAVFVANLIFSLALFLARSCIIYYVNPLNTPITRENQDFINFLRNLLPWFLGWVIISAILVVIMNILVPFIHKNFYILRTPPGEPDKVIPIQRENIRRSA